MRVLLTRSEEDSLRVAAHLKPHGITSIIWPVMKIEPVPFDGALPVKTDCVIVTSSAAVQTAPRLLAKAMCPVFCVGDRTAAMARAAGAGDVRSAGGEVGDLVTLVAGAGVRSDLYLRGLDVATDLTAALSPHGIAVSERVTYAAVDAGAPESDVAAALEAGEIDAVTIWSSRSAARFCSFVATNRQ
ncbi:MAG: uroporphyrinogen-III synthase, partial [Pseudomonadota bacterium]